MLCIKRLSDEFDRKQMQLINTDFAILKDQPDLSKELLEDKTSYGETFSETFIEVVMLRYSEQRGARGEGCGPR